MNLTDDRGLSVSTPSLRFTEHREAWYSGNSVGVISEDFDSILDGATSDFFLYLLNSFVFCMCVKLVLSV
jgi:hypothetical protein